MHRQGDLAGLHPHNRDHLQLLSIIVNTFSVNFLYSAVLPPPIIFSDDITVTYEDRDTIHFSINSVSVIMDAILVIGAM